MEKILFLLTGGTIDSYYSGKDDTAKTNKTSVIPDYIDSLNLNLNQNQINFTEVCMKDSREINQQDRTKLVELIDSAEENNMIITHGTYTMPDTARYIKQHIKSTDKKIILTGSMIPLVGFSPSDAGFNLGYAIASFRAIKEGVYISMNGQIFEADEVIKDLAEGRFSSINR
jgi:L-asparaginase